MCSNGDFAVEKYTFDYKIIAKANISYIFVQYRNIEGMFMITLTGVVFRSISHTQTKHNDWITRSFRKLTKYYNYERIIRLFLSVNEIVLYIPLFKTWLQCGYIRVVDLYVCYCTKQH